MGGNFFPPPRSTVEKLGSAARDAARRFLLAHSVIFVVIAFATQPPSADPWLELFARVVVCTVGAIVLTGLVAAVRRRLEPDILRRSFVVGMWLVLAFGILGERR